MLVDLFALLPHKRRYPRLHDASAPAPLKVAVALTAYQDEEESIALAVSDSFYPLVSRLIVVDNDSADGTVKAATRAGVEVIVERNRGYGSCVYRCLSELAQSKEEFVVLCEGDMTFRARDLEKLVAFAPHADIVNGTRIVEQLRAYDTQLSTFMYYGNFFVGKLLEIKHIGRGTFTDVGTTYKLLRRSTLPTILQAVKPSCQSRVQRSFVGSVSLARPSYSRVPSYVPRPRRFQQGWKRKQRPCSQGGIADDCGVADRLELPSFTPPWCSPLRCPKRRQSTMRRRSLRNWWNELVSQWAPWDRLSCRCRSPVHHNGYAAGVEIPSEEEVGYGDSYILYYSINILFSPE